MNMLTLLIVEWLMSTETEYVTLPVPSELLAVFDDAVSAAESASDWADPLAIRDVISRFEASLSSM
jgi:hypothetical protein